MLQRLPASFAVAPPARTGVAIARNRGPDTLEGTGASDGLSGNGGNGRSFGRCGDAPLDCAGGCDTRFGGEPGDTTVNCEKVL